MSNIEKKSPEAPATEKEVQPKESVVDAVFDVAEAWIGYGLGVAKGSLEASAKTLEKTAMALDTLKRTLSKKAA